MNAFPTYLWKEWREQRATLGLLALALAVGVGVVVATLPRTAVGDPLTFQCVVWLSLAATVLTIGADLLARERERGLRFLERQPAGLAAAFRAKLAFLVLAMGAALVFGALLASASAWLRVGTLPEKALELDFAQPLGLLLVLSLWTFAVSAWMPTSALTLPASALLLAAFAWPAIPAILGHPLYRPTSAQVWSFAALGVLGAPASAWAAFVVGSRAGRTRRAAACAGLAVAAAAFAPSWGWAASRHLAVRNAPLQFHLAWTGVNGRHAFVNVGRGGVDDERDGRCSALVVDLADGSWRFAGPRDASAFQPMPAFRRDRSEPESPCDRPIVLKDCTVEPWIESLVDAETAQAWGVRPVDVAEGVSPSAFGLEQDPLTWSVTPAGAGLRLQYRDGNRTRFRYLDRSGHVVVDDALPRDEHDRAPMFVLMRPGRWLVYGPKRWLLFDPVSGSHERWSHCARNETVSTVLHDGRAVLLSGRRLHLLDVETGARTELRAPDGTPVESNMFQVPGGGPWSSLPADRPSLVSLGDFPYDSRLAWIDPTNATVKSGPSGGERFLRILWSDGPRAIVLEGTQRLAFHDLERNERRVILDAADVR